MRTPNINTIIHRQIQLLHKFAAVSETLRGMAAILWLPGLRQRFKGLRAVRGIRPLCVSLEVAENGKLTLSGAISRPKAGKLLFDTLFKYDFSQPMCDKQVGSALSAKNEVIANSGLNLLQRITYFGEQCRRTARYTADTPRWPMYLVPFDGEPVYDEEKLAALAVGMAPEFLLPYKTQLKKDFTDLSTPGMPLVNAAIVPDQYISAALDRGLGYEDYSPVLGVPHWNPANALREQPNPALPLLAKHDVLDLETICQDKLDEVMRDFRATVTLGECLTDEDIYDALCNPSAPVVFSQGIAHAERRRLLSAMRNAANNSRAARDASNNDLLTAASSSGKLIISALSAVQVCTVESLQEMPAPYAGGVLPSQDWEPLRRRAAAAPELV